MNTQEMIEAASKDRTPSETIAFLIGRIEALEILVNAARELQGLEPIETLEQRLTEQQRTKAA